MAFEDLQVDTFEELRDVVEENGGKCVVKVEILRNLTGHSKMGKHVVAMIDEMLEDVGLELLDDLPMRSNRFVELSLGTVSRKNNRTMTRTIQEVNYFIRTVSNLKCNGVKLSSHESRVYSAALDVLEDYFTVSS